MVDSVIVTEEVRTLVTEVSNATTVISAGITGATVLASETKNTLVVETQTTLLLSEGSQGPQGPAGIMDEEMTYSKRVDFVTNSLFYRGEAAVGANVTDAVWRIRKIEIGIDGDITETWANGSAIFSQVWDNRSLLTYS